MWETKRLKDVTTLITKGTTPTTVGCAFEKDGINYIKAESIGAGRELDSSKFAYISESTHDKLKRSQIQTGDILFSMAGYYLGKTAIVTNKDVPANTNQAVAIIRINPKMANPDYVYYWLNQPIIKSLVNSSSSQSAQPNINLKDIGNIELSCPDLDTQKRIVSFLLSMDEKIRINTEINQNLLQQLSSVFKRWFTDNPCIDTMEQVPLSDLCEVVTKGTTPTTLGKSFKSEGIKFLKAESIQDNHSIDHNKLAYIDEETNMLLKRSIIQSGDIVFTIAGTLGRFALVDESVTPANTNQAVAIIRSDKNRVSSEYLYSFFVGNWHNDYYTKRIQQAVQANLSLGTIKSLPIPILSDEDMHNYISIIQPIISMTKANEIEIRTLEELRDSLLPKLMSGEIDVSDIEINR